MREIGRDVQASGWRIGPDAENGLQQVEDASGGPGLRHVRLGIENGEGPSPPFDTGVEIGQPITYEVARPPGDAARNARRLGSEAVTPEAERDDAVVMRPHRASLIGERIVRRVCRG